MQTVLTDCRTVPCKALPINTASNCTVPMAITKLHYKGQRGYRHLKEEISTLKFLMTKPLSLADRILQSKKDNENKDELNKEKKLIQSFTEPQDGKDSEGSGQGQVYLIQSGPSVDKVSTLGQVKVGSGSGQGQVSGIGSGSGQGQVSGIGSGSGQGQVSNIDTLKIVLAPKQQKIYEWFLTNGLTGYFNKGIISRNTGINIPTIRKSLTKFKNLSLIQTYKYDPMSRLQEYKINADINVTLLSGSGQGQVSGIGSGSGQGQVSGIGSGSGQGQSILNSSSSLYINKTTTTEINIELNNNSELGFWKQKKLTSKQIIAWMKTADCNLDAIIKYLCYCRFEMVDLDLEKSKPIKNVFNWFFKILEKTGGYPKPKDYKSFQDKKITIERELIEKQENEALELKKLYQRKIEAEQDKKFWSMMSEPEGKLYKKCFEELNDFQKKRNTGKAFEMSMKDIFKKL